MSSGTEIKSTGSFYTPRWCVDILLAMSGFACLKTPELLEANVIDPACGDGAILCRIAESAIKTMQESDIEKIRIASWIHSSLWGIELDENEAEKCRCNVLEICQSYDVPVQKDMLNIICANTFDVINDFQHRFRYVIGNPPYVRIHNLDSKPKSTYISGMCDLYFAFFDIGQQMLTPDGVLCFIAPSSWMTNEAGALMREDLYKKRNITAVLDFEHYQVFDNATTYTAIVVLDGSGTSHDEIEKWTYNADIENAFPVNNIPFDAMWNDGKFYVRDIRSISKILSYDLTGDNSRGIAVRNGYATLCDKAFISKSGFDGCDEFEIDVIKSSKAITQKAIYPYDETGNLVTLEEIERESPATFEHLLEWKDKLLARNKIDPKHWWAYGRTQGICDTFKDKVTVQSIVKEDKEILTEHAGNGTGVYGGLYVTGLSKSEIDEVLKNSMFMEYVKALGKYKSGGYYAFSGKELERYLRFVFD